MSGVVTDKQSHKPIEGATVTVVGNKANQALTDSEGSFILTFAEGVQEGEPIRIRVEKLGYRIYEALKAVSSTIPLQVSLEPAAPPPKSKTAPSAASSPPPISKTAGVCGDEGSVLILAKNGMEDPRAKEISEQLTGQGCSVEVEKPEKPNEKIEWTEVRYFHRLDQRIAREIVQFIRSQVKLKAVLTDMVSWCKQHDCDVKTGHFEIWVAD